MCCHCQLARSPAPPSPQHDNSDDRGHLREQPAGQPAVTHVQRSGTQGVVALAMFALWVVLPWLLAALMCRRSEDRDQGTSRRPGAIRQIFALALWHKHFYEYARETSKQLRALMRELRESGSDMTRGGQGKDGQTNGRRLDGAASIRAEPGPAEGGRARLSKGNDD